MIEAKAPPSPSRIGFLGGSFDPVHNGHLLVAQDAIEQLELDKVYFVPSPHTPLRETAPAVEAVHRVAMLDLALRGDKQMRVEDCEIRLPAPSYTVDTLERLRVKYRDARLFWIVGADHVTKFARWRQPHRLLELAELIVVGRPGKALTVPAGFPPERFHLVHGHPFEVSSSELRKRISQGMGARFFLPRAVEAYIETHRLYCD
ncbi:nicotinate (nicotinamide) nucleotide adenylyltransferase [Ruficoccus sp. ZRK36]|uniref:nicotinate (nicotinamide) nucleotide adenylyltransferase n=1 Tax=Ruficoccus sp. ZRK36 TaxID=2866311 RepID=UPI001C73C465|nr:nicotinate (nicotinamide) nucleotide adenylyltransferase [Ruficoccus sp. ZRK36]QYY36211.1 nicotinate (nicotinamide) nucleotide adenylyltransferase [Ruficoccus sp. ZRK36]